jgi:hypothetical protein
MYKNELPRASANASFGRRSRVRLRRYLSEFRDNFVAKNDAILLMAMAAKRKLWSRTAQNG